MMHNEGFGKRWIDKILGKVDKDQGVANAGKVLGIGADGIVTPVEQSGGSDTRLTGSFSTTQFMEKVANGELKVGNVISFYFGVDRKKISSAEFVVISQSPSLRALANIGYTTSNINMIIHALVIKIETSESGITTITFLPALVSSNTNYELTIGGESLMQRITTEFRPNTMSIISGTLLASVSASERIVVDDPSIVGNIDTGVVLGGTSTVFGNILVY